MKIIKAYILGLSKTLSSFGLTTIMYVFTLIIGLIIAFPFKSALTKVANFSMSPPILLQDFNYTVYEDLMRNYGDALKPFVQIIFWVGLAYYIFSVFIAGGIFNILHNEKNNFSIKSFFEGSGKYFYRFLRLAGIVIILNIVIAFVIYIPLGMVFDSVSETVESEASLFYIGLGGVLLHLLLIILVLIVSDYTKIKLVTEETTKVFRTFWQSIKFTFRYIHNTYSLYMMLLIFPLLLMVVYYFVENSIGMTSGITILIMFLVQQLFVWLRQFSKVWNYSSQLSYHNNYIQPKIEKALPKPTEEFDLKDLEDDIPNSDLIA